MLLGLALGLTVTGIFQRITRMRDVLEALAWGRGGAYGTIHEFSLCELFAFFRCSDFLFFFFFLPFTVLYQ